METNTAASARFLIVLARIEMTGVRKTGRMVERDRNTFPEFEAAPEAKACCWKNHGTASDEAKARSFAEREGYTVFTFPTNEKDPLGKAKLLIAKGAKS